MPRLVVTAEHYHRQQNWAQAQVAAAGALENWLRGLRCARRADGSPLLTALNLRDLLHWYNPFSHA